MFEKLSRYRIAKNVSVLAATQMLSRIAALFYVAALARYIGSEGIGVLSTATSLNGLLLLIAGPGLSVLFVRDVAARTGRAGSYLTQMLYTRIALFIPFVLVALLAAGRYPTGTAAIIHLYTLVYIADSLSEIAICVFRAHERMEYEAGLQIARDVINISLSLLAVALAWSLEAIVLVSLLASAVRLALALRLVWTRFARPRLRPDLRLSKTLLVASVPFGILMIIQTLQAELGTFVLSLYYNAEVVGIYAAANTLVIILLMIPNAFANAIFPNLSRMYQHARRDLREYYRLSFKYLLALGFPLGLGVILVGGEAIRLIYGDEFAASTPVIQIMAVFLFTIVGYVNGPVLQATGRQRFFAITQGIAALVNCALCFVLVPLWGANGAALAFAICGLLTFVVHSAACHRQLDLPLPARDLAQIATATALMGGVVALCISAGISWLVASLLVAPPVYFGLLISLRALKWDELRVLAGAEQNPPSSSDVMLGMEARL